MDLIGLYVIFANSAPDEWENVAKQDIEFDVQSGFSQGLEAIKQYQRNRFHRAVLPNGGTIKRAAHRLVLTSLSRYTQEDISKPRTMVSVVSNKTSKPLAAFTRTSSTPRFTAHGCGMGAQQTTSYSMPLNKVLGRNTSR